MIEASASRPSRFPFPPFPRGWFAVSPGPSLAPGEVRRARYFGRELVLWRDTTSHVRVFDAFCPHRGTHLGLSGEVLGDSLRCSLHHWRFGPDGHCVAAPGMRPDVTCAGLRAWPVRERNGMILVYYPGRLNPEADITPRPADELPRIPELSSPDWTPCRLLHFTLRSRNQEVMENSFDAAHFVYIHGTPHVPLFDKVELDEHSMRVFTEALDVRVHGLGLLVVRDLSGLAGRCRGNMHASFVTPIDEETIEVWMNVTVHRMEDASETHALEVFWQNLVRENFERDIVIWEHKAYIANPILAENDGPIPTFRRWAQQFYS